MTLAKHAKLAREDQMTNISQRRQLEKCSGLACLARAFSSPNAVLGAGLACAARELLQSQCELRARRSASQ